MTSSTPPPATAPAVTLHRAGRTYRYWVVDDGHRGAPVVVSIDARTAGFDAFLTDATVLLDSLRFTP